MNGNLRATRQSGKIIGKLPLTLYQEAAIGGVQRFHAFDREVVWLAHSTTQLYFVHGGNTVMDGPEFNDWYGYHTSLDRDEDDELEKLLKHYSIDANSTLEIQLVTTQYLSPFLEDKECIEWNATAAERKVKVKLIDMPREYRLPAEIDYGDGVKTYYQTIDSISMKEEITWSSKNTVAQNLKLKNAFKTKWGEERLADMLRIVEEKIDARLHETT